MIQRDGDEIRILRDDRCIKMLATLVVLCALVVVVPAAVATLATQPDPIGSFFVILLAVAVLAALGRRFFAYRPIIVLRPEEVLVEGLTPWVTKIRRTIPRSEISYVTVGSWRWLDVTFFRTDQRQICDIRLFCINREEVRDAIRAAGLPVK